MQEPTRVCLGKRGHVRIGKRDHGMDYPLIIKKRTVYMGRKKLCFYIMQSTYTAMRMVICLCTKQMHYRCSVGSVSVKMCRFFAISVQTTGYSVDSRSDESLLVSVCIWVTQLGYESFQHGTGFAKDEWLPGKVLFYLHLEIAS